MDGSFRRYSTVSSPPPLLLLLLLQDYEEFSEAKAWDLLAAVSLDESDMQRLSEQLFGDSGEAVGAGLSIGGFAQAAAAAAAADAVAAKSGLPQQASLVAACS
jgi:hypothetical protein